MSSIFPLSCTSADTGRGKHRLGISLSRLSSSSPAWRPPPPPALPAPAAAELLGASRSLTCCPNVTPASRGHMERGGGVWDLPLQLPPPTMSPPLLFNSPATDPGCLLMTKQKMPSEMPKVVSVPLRGCQQVSRYPACPGLPGVSTGHSRKTGRACHPGFG